MFIQELKQEIRYIKGIGPKLAQLFQKMGIRTIADLLLQFPRAYEDRRSISTLKEALLNKKVNIIATVVAQDYMPTKKRPILKVYIQDDSGSACLVCFGRDYLKNVLLPGKRFFISADFTYRFGEKQSSNFDFEPYEEPAERFRRILPLYPLTAGLTQTVFYKAVKNALALYAHEIDDELPRPIREKYRFAPKAKDLGADQFPENEQALLNAVRHLKYEELFFLLLIMTRHGIKRSITRRSRKPIGHRLSRSLRSRLPFSLTADQENAADIINSDIFSAHPMARLLQGDVGCGKTLVAVLACLSVIEAGEQAVLMAPTELLARQHASYLARLLEPLGVTVAFLSGSVTGEARRLLLDALKQGRADLIIGTHALFSEDVVYKKLGLIVIDEQHRFGVLQRKALLEKGTNPDLLLMTATPIPRSLALTVFGDLQNVTIKTKPRGRKPVITHLTREGNEDRVYERVRRELKQGRQAYFVYPLISESEKSDLKAAESMYKDLTNRLFADYSVGLIHSRLPEEQKQKTMEAFALNNIQILVATSVVEVGMDVVNATCMVIEHAERFGLSQLHQLRGRVGRSELQSYAFLVYASTITEDGIRRLKIMMQTSDGFRIAEEDMKIRGPGALLGVEQSGFLKLRIADLISDLPLLMRAREDVQDILQSDPGLLQPEHTVVQQVLQKAPPFSDDLMISG
ncbi:MAG: ATP-dependent DNA helicase RecG [Spirochaetia bacterium]